MKKPFKLMLPIVVALILAPLIFIFAIPGSSESPRQIPRKVLFGHPVKTNPLLSPDGQQLAFLAPDSNGVLNVWVEPIGDSSQAIQVTTDRKRGVRAYFWQRDGSGILYVQDSDGDEDWHLYQTLLSSKVTRDLTPFSGVHASIVSYNQDHPNEILVGLNLRDATLFDVYRLQLDSGALTLDTENPGDVNEWVADNDLQVRAARAYTPDGGIVIRVRDTEKDSWRDLLTWGPEEGLGTAEAFTPDNKGLYVLTSLGGNTVRLDKVDVATGKRETVVQDPSYDVDSILMHPVTHKLQAVGVERERYGWIVVDPSLEGDFKTIEKFAGPAFQLVSRSRDDNQWVVAARKDDKPTTFYLYDRNSKKSKFLFTTLPELNEYTLVPTQPIKFTARDGLKLEGYLTVPAGRKPKDLPTVLLVHGGPWIRDTWGFNPIVQWLANRGYAVLQVNFRGSTGYGKDFVNAGNKEWGAKMHDDIIDAKRWMIERGIADPNKVAIYGGSYGGYATLAGLAFTPEEFCCGVDIVGPSSLLTLLSTLPPYWEPFRALFDQRVGSLTNEEEFLKERSPLYKADQITKPLLIAQGARDPRVKQQESDQIVAAMRAHHRPVEYLVFEDEGHGFARPENKLRFYAAAESFLAEYLGGTAQPPESDEEWESLKK